MTPTDECTHCDHLTAIIDAAHEQALRALTDEQAPLDAVVWLSAHLAAVDRVVVPALRRHVPGAAATLREQEQLSTEMQHALRLMEQLLAGDALARRLDRNRIRDHLVSLLSRHVADEHLLLDALARAIGPESAAALAERYERAVAAGPTRPHPHTAHEGVPSRAAFVLNRMRDHVLDVLDNRHVPIPRRRRAAPANGKWGRYLLGG